MIRWLTRLRRKCVETIFGESAWFRIPRPMRPLPLCRFRPYADADFDACCEIYRLNEPGRFPPGYFGDFTEWLQDARFLILVGEAEGGVVRCVGGIHVDPPPHTGLTGLTYGMVHPALHRRGYGTALLLARLACLPAPISQWWAFIITTGGSETFYRRFGFVPHARQTDERGTEFDGYWTRLEDRHRLACRAALAAAGIVLDAPEASAPAVTTK